MWAALIIVAGIGIFVVSYRVQALENQLHAKQRQIEHDRTTIRVLEAEWAYLNDPGRLRRLSEQHFGLAAPTPATITTFDRLPLKGGAAWSAASTAPSAPRPETPHDDMGSVAAPPDGFSLAQVKAFFEPVWNGPAFLRASFRTEEAPR